MPLIIFASGILFFLTGITCLLLPHFTFQRFILPWAQHFSRTGHIEKVATIQLLYREWSIVGVSLISLVGITLLVIGFILHRLASEAKEKALVNGFHRDINQEKESSFYVYSLILIITIAAILRSINLNMSLWGDEISTVEVFIKPLRFWRYVELGDHWIYSFLGFSSIKLFGESEVIVRLPAFLLSIITIPAIYYFTHYFFSRKEALVASLALCFSAFHIRYTDEARGYTALALFSLLASFSFLKIILNKHPAKRENFLFGLFTALGCLSHFYYIWVLFAQLLTIVVLFIYERFIKKKITILTAEGGTNLLYSMMIGQLVALLIYGPNLITAIIFKYISWKGVGDIVSFGTLGHLFTGRPSTFFGILFTILIIFALVDLWNSRKGVLVLYFISLVILPFIIASFLVKAAFTRYFIYSIPFLIAYLTHGMMAIARKQRSYVFLSLVLLFIAIQSPYLAFYFRHYKSGAQDHRSLGQLIDRQVAKDDIVYSIGVGFNEAQYYIKRHRLEFPDAQEFFSQVDSARHRIWLIVTFPEFIYRGPQESRMLLFARKNFRLAGYFPGLETDLFLYVNEPD